MPKRITRVRWSASNIPWGLSFNESTGTFSGTPEDEGEYIVPVTVETNYGRDAKDVIIRTLPTSYSVYSIGGLAQTWSNGASPDNNGFYKLNMPNAYELKPHYNGFGAMSEDGNYYCTGPYFPVYSNGVGSVLANTTAMKIASTPICLYDQIYIERNNGQFSADELEILAGVDRVIYSPYSYYYSYSSSRSTSRAQTFLILWNSSKAKCIVYSSSATETQTISGQSTTTWSDTSQGGGVWQGTNPDLSTVNILPANAKEALGESSYVPSNFIRSLANSNTTLNRGTVPVELGYKAKKVFQFSTTGGNLAFETLSDNMLLDNNADNFTHGTIKDAWCYGIAAYVLNSDNQLYSYTFSSKSWELLAAIDIKKAEIPNPTLFFALSNDGKLFHKGSAVSGVTEQHSTLTQIFTGLRFKDFTFSGATLTVLKE